MTEPKKRAAKKTSTRRAHTTKTVAEEAPPAHEEETVADPPGDAVAPQEAEAVAAPTEPDAPIAAAVPAPMTSTSLGTCVACGAPAIVRAEFPWTADTPQFCRKDLPPQYRFLLNP